MLNNNGIVLKELFEFLHKENNKSFMNVRRYIDYKVNCLNESEETNFTPDTFIEGERIYYFYSGHDSFSFIRKIENDDDYNKIMDWIKQIRNGREYYYVELVIIENGKIYIY